MAKIGNSTLRISDLGGGINRLKAGTDIENNQAIISNNWGVEGNKLVSLKGFAAIHKFGSTNSRIQALDSYGDYLVGIQGSSIYVHNLVTGVDDSLAISGISNSDDFNITIGKFIDVYIVVTSKDGLYAPLVFKYVESTTTLTNDSANFVGLVANFKPTSSIFYRGQLIFGGTPLAPSVLYYSKSYVSTDVVPSWYIFNAYPAGAQTIGDGSPIVGFLTGQDKVYIGKRNSIWKIDSYIDDGTSFSYQITKQTSTGPLNQESFINVLQDIIFYDGHSVRRLSYESNTLALKDSPISDEISPYIGTFPSNQSSSTSWFTYPYYKLAIRQELSTDNDFVFFYNVINKSWGTQTGLITRHSISGYDDKGIAYFGSSYDGTVYKDNTTYTYDSQSIPRSYVGKYFAFGDDVDYKRLTEVEISGQIQPGHLVYIDIIKEGTVIDTREIFVASSYGATTGSSVIGATLAGASGLNSEPLAEYRFRYEMYDDGRNFEIGVRDNGTGYFELSTLNMMYKFLKSYDVHY